MRRALKQIFAFGAGIYLIISGLSDGDYLILPILGALLVCWAIIDILGEKNRKFYKASRIYGSIIGAAIIIIGIIGAILDYDFFFVILMVLGVMALLTNLIPIIVKNDQNDSMATPAKPLEQEKQSRS